MLEDLKNKHCGHPYLMDEEGARKSLNMAFDSLLSGTDYKKIGEIMDKNKERFFELFSKWFYNLWD